MNNGHFPSEHNGEAFNTPLRLTVEEDGDLLHSLEDVVAEELRNFPQAWLPDPDDEASWTQFVLDADADAKALGIDLSIGAAAANEAVFIEMDVYASPRAARAALSDYLKQCRTDSGISLTTFSENIPTLSPHDIRRWEDKTQSLYPAIENREGLFVAWVQCIKARWSRVLRLVSCASFPPEWQEIGDGKRLTYAPAGTSSDQAEYPLPQRAQKVVERLETAWNENNRV